MTSVQIPHVPPASSTEANIKQSAQGLGVALPAHKDWRLWAGEHQYMYHSGWKPHVGGEARPVVMRPQNSLSTTGNAP